MYTYTLLELESKTFGELKKIGDELNVLPEGDRRCRQTWIEAIAGVNLPLLALLEVSPAVEVQAQEPIIETVEPSSGVEVEPIQEAPLESKFGRIVYPRPAQGAIVSVAENPPGVEVDSVEEALPECFECFGDGYVEDTFGFIKCCSKCLPENKSEPKVSQSAIALAAKISPGVEVDDCVYCTSPEYSSLRDKSYRCYRCQPDEADLNPILTGISLSDRFLARYTPPQPQNIRFQVEADGQLSLVDFEVLTEPEPPDPDDFESLDAFREAIARWDAQNPEPLAVSLDSMCEWAPCPHEWYEPTAEILPSKASSMMELPEQSEVLELLRAGESSDTLDFFILTFDAWCDRSNRSDEPPDTGIFARLPKPKPPNFPPTTPNSDTTRTQLGHISKLSRSYPETIWATTQLIRSGANRQLARSPPGGDA